jgi:hypothetical protein
MPRLVAVRTPFTPGPMSEQRCCQEHDAARVAATLPHWQRAEGASAMLGFSAMYRSACERRSGWLSPAPSSVASAAAIADAIATDSGVCCADSPADGETSDGCVLATLGDAHSRENLFWKVWRGGASGREVVRSSATCLAVTWYASVAMHSGERIKAGEALYSFEGGRSGSVLRPVAGIRDGRGGGGEGGAVRVRGRIVAHLLRWNPCD